MDYNDLRARLSRTLSSLNARFIEDLEHYTRVEEWPNGKGFSIVFGSDDDPEILNKIMIILYNLASLKDHIKNKLEAKGMNRQIAEDEINNSLHLQVLVDIVNQDKHGPLQRSRSNKNPVIRYPSVGYFPFVNKAGSPDGDDEGLGCMVIKALVKDDRESLIFSLDELVETCFAKWDDFIRMNSLI